MSLDAIIVGGGIIGTSVAMTLSEQFPSWSILLLEKEPQLAAHQSGRNSGVIHSGIYYPPGSLKAKTCVAGAAEMLRFCQAHQIPVEVCGKVIVATSEADLPALEELRRRSEAHGVPGVRLLTRQELREIEPHSEGVQALRVPGTGITDYAAVTRKYAEIASARGVEVRTGARVLAICERQNEVVVETGVGAFTAKVLVNCGGLHSDELGRAAGANTGVRIIPFRGEYYRLAEQRRALVRGLIYPVPDPRFPFLGVHFTKRINGEVEAGPNAVLALKREGYGKLEVGLRDALGAFSYGGFWRMAAQHWKQGAGEMWRSFSKRAFVRALQKLMPELQASDLVPGGCGIRAQAVDAQGKLVDDFAFCSTQRALHVCNVPSPAATASLPLGRMIVSKLAEALELPARARQEAKK